MMAPVVKLALSGTSIPVNLTTPDQQPMTRSEARRRIAKHVGKPTGCLQLIDPVTGELVEDEAAISTRIQVIILSLDPGVERAAEAKLFVATVDSRSSPRVSDSSRPSHHSTSPATNSLVSHVA